MAIDKKDMIEGVVYDSQGNPKSYISNGNQIVIGSKSDTSKAQEKAGIKITTEKTSTVEEPKPVETTEAYATYDTKKQQARASNWLEIELAKQKELERSRFISNPRAEAMDTGCNCKRGRMQKVC